MIPMYPETAKQTLKCPFNRGHMCEAHECPAWETFDIGGKTETVTISDELVETIYEADIATRKQLVSDWIKSEIASRPEAKLDGEFDGQVVNALDRIMRSFDATLYFHKPAEQIAGYCKPLDIDEDFDEDEDIK